MPSERELSEAVVLDFLRTVRNPAGPADRFQRQAATKILRDHENGRSLRANRKNLRFFGIEYRNGRFFEVQVTG